MLMSLSDLLHRFAVFALDAIELFDEKGVDCCFDDIVS
jgi:hypothetical protein